MTKWLKASPANLVARIVLAMSQKEMFESDNSQK